MLSADPDTTLMYPVIGNKVVFSVAQMYQYFPYRLSVHHTHSLPSTRLCLQLEGLLEALVKLLCSGRQRAGEPVPADAEGSTEHTWGGGAGGSVPQACTSAGHLAS